MIFGNQRTVLPKRPSPQRPASNMRCRPPMILPPPLLRCVEDDSLCDRRTLARFLAGEPVRPASAARIRRAMARLGLPDPTRENERTAVDDRRAP